MLAFDLVGFSRLTSDNEQRTLARLFARRATAIDPTVHEHRGRVVKGTGDGILATFASAQDAIQCGVALHAALAAANEREPGEPPMLARIGITIGDIFREEGGDIFGDGVNIAARLESRAPTGGICVSGRALEDLRRVGVPFVDFGEILFKNMVEPIRVLCIQPVGLPLPAIVAPSRRLRRYLVRSRMAVAVAAVLAVGVVVVLKTLTASAAKAAGLSVMVMPLRDLSDRPGNGYLADAISDDLTTDLSHLPGSTVIARETAESYKGRAVPVAEIGRKLGVEYLLEGSVRAEAGVLHVNAQLIDTQTSTQVWAERFDAPQRDPDQAREAIVRRLANVLDVELVAAETARGERERPSSPDARDLFFRARSVLDHGDGLKDFQQAQRLLEKAVAMQPDFVEAQAALASMLLSKVRTVDDPSDQADFAEAQAMTAKALKASPRNGTALAARAFALLIEGKPIQAGYAAKDALAAEPDNLAALSVVASCASAQGKLDQAAAALGTLLRLNPEATSARSRLLQLANVRLLQGKPSDAIDLLHRAVASDPEPAPGADSWGRAEGARMLLIGAYAEKGDLAAAHGAYDSYDRLWPHRTVWRIRATAPKAMASLAGFDRFLTALRAVGMPETADEHIDLHIQPSATPVRAESFAATPTTIPGAQAIDTARLKTLAAEHPLVVDLGRGAAVPAGAVWQDPEAKTKDDMAFVDTAVARAGRRASDPIVLMSDGVFGYAAYNAALHLVARKFTDIYWYRGGEEAWAAAKAPATDRRI